MRTMKHTAIALLLMVGLSVHAEDKKVNIEKTTIQWNGKKVTGEHHGSIKLKSGSLNMNNGTINGGVFLIDMSSLVNEDLSGGMKEKLEGHLKSDDFFGVEKYPLAKLVIKEATAFKDDMSTVKADLTIKGITNPVSFDVKRVKSAYHAVITVDRSRYDVRYGSGKFFDNLGDKTIYDDFTLDVMLVVE